MLAAVVLGALRRAVRAAADGWLAHTLRPVADGRRHRRAGQLRGALHPVPRSGREGTGDEGGASSPRRRPTPIRARRRPRPHSGSRGALRSPRASTSRTSVWKGVCRLGCWESAFPGPSPRGPRGVDGPAGPWALGSDSPGCRPRAHGCGAWTGGGESQRGEACHARCTPFVPHLCRPLFDVLRKDVRPP